MVIEKQPSIAAVIPLYNKQETIARTLRSVFNQSHLPEEIILIDDGSTDASLERARSITNASKHRNIRIIETPNNGVASARNIGAETATTDIVCFLDADDEWLPDFIIKIKQLARTYPEASLFTLGHIRQTSDGRYIKQATGLPPSFKGVVADFLIKYTKGYGLIHSSAVGIRRRLFKNGAGFPAGATKGEDIYTWLTLALQHKIAHNSDIGTIRHEDFEGTAGRQGVVPYHLKRFLGGPEQSVLIDHPELAAFLRRNTLVHLVAHKVNGDAKVSSWLVKNSRYLGIRSFITVAICNLIPRNMLSHLMQRDRSRRLKRTSIDAHNGESSPQNHSLV